MELVDALIAVDVQFVETLQGDMEYITKQECTGSLLRNIAKFLTISILYYDLKQVLEY